MESFSKSMYSFLDAGLIPVHIPLAFVPIQIKAKVSSSNVNCENSDLTTRSARYTGHAHIRILTIIPVTARDSS